MILAQLSDPTSASARTTRAQAPRSPRRSTPGVTIGSDPPAFLVHTMDVAQVQPI
jgi:hypothetical protein